MNIHGAGSTVGHIILPVTNGQEQKTETHTIVASNKLSIFLSYHHWKFNLNTTLLINYWPNQQTNYSSMTFLGRYVHKCSQIDDMEK